MKSSTFEQGLTPRNRNIEVFASICKTAQNDLEGEVSKEATNKKGIAEEILHTNTEKPRQDNCCEIL